MEQEPGGARRGIQAVERAFDIVETVMKMDGATTVELATQLDMPVSTTFDHLDTLEHLEYLVKRDDEYHVSTKFLYVGNKMRNQHRIYQASQSELLRLARNTGHHSLLSMKEGGYVVIFNHAAGDTNVSLLGWGGVRVLLHQAATGKAILSYMDRQEVESYVGEYGLPTKTSNTISNQDALFAELDRIAEQGYALDREETKEGTYGVAVPILDESRERALASISVYAPADHEIESFLEQVQAPLERTAHSIELDLTSR